MAPLADSNGIYDKEGGLTLYEIYDRYLANPWLADILLEHGHLTGRIKPVDTPRPYQILDFGDQGSVKMVRTVEGQYDVTIYKR